ncbi:putative ABC-type transport system protein [Mycoplasmoides gallisepticum CA06_2006.052-5-2P]|uniref:Putative ABC-type transport system protein n=1 Tax=Mycoplasmoides gallisepticum WI01_2001.043-13-2P TaxID=1159201 RepID=J3T8Z1_MYCGL|nr:ABC-2 transporter permease [Mycoplasmoides gallisepticum]AFP75737.1 putative ABC-type transport system protein [Mycoplasmoides gallisepticum VA94_7994-1-7P]AFP76504.1 putative ABC-type transport system protein [Mycoplasmoides gallisepticum NC95_13295-2-2P]AFP77258.1 putative ABC-type transport system protein [Mycoplasmoides gallisepticum NC96_1596-4-2P]AFP78029.1 putative ABC-type transport system protein [Mycoplasmoides gallisepticum NY01_2001.047-5-1P]AFP78789.1 putative ABC-type transpor
MKSVKSYVYFLHKIILKKKSSYVLPIVFFALAIIFSITLSVVQIPDRFKNFTIYAIIFAEMILTIFYASLKALNIYKDLEEEGLELLTYSKPINRRDIFIAKFIVFIIFDCYWAILMMVSNLILVLNLKETNLTLIVLLSFTVFFFAFLIFGLFASIIGYKFNGKIALAIPLTIISPLIIGGSVVSSQSTSSANNLAFYLNTKRLLQPAGNEANVETFYLNNNQDNFYILPNGYDEPTFSQKQTEYLRTAYNLAKNSSTEWQIYSWLVTPYQMIDIFNFKNQNIFNTFQSNYTTNLDNYLYYNKLDAPTYSYQLNENNVLPRYLVNIRDDKTPNYQDVYLVPGALKNNLNPSLDELNNTKIIYARQDADNFDITFPEDEFNNTNASDIVGKLNWTYIKELLDSKVFNAYSKQFIDNLIKSEGYINGDPSDLTYYHNLLMSEIQNEITDEQSKFNNLDDNITVLEDSSITNKIIKSNIERQIYLTVALVYYIYFNQNNDLLTTALLFNNKLDDNSNNFTPKQLSFNYGAYTYHIGGYANYSTKQEVQNNKVIIRYDLKKSNNFVFQPVTQIMQMTRNKEIINKYSFILLWAVIASLFVVANNILYIRKDYK